MVDLWAAIWATLAITIWLGLIVLDYLALERWTKTTLIANGVFIGGALCVVFWMACYRRFHK